MEHRLYDLKNLDKHTRELIVQNEIDMMLEGKVCTICGKGFVTRDEKDNTFCAGNDNGKLSYAHEECWPNK